MRPYDLSTFRALEESLHRTVIRRSLDKLRQLLADGFVEIGSSGNVYGKAEVIAALVEESTEESGPAAISADDFVLRSIAADTVLLTYRSKPAYRAMTMSGRLYAAPCGSSSTAAGR